MKYLDYLSSNRITILNQLSISLHNHQVQPVGNGYIDCITMIDNLDLFIEEISDIRILISDVTWWCYVDPSRISSGCPHGMGGPKSEYYEGWFSELQNEMYETDKELVASIIDEYDKQLITTTNLKTKNDIRILLKEPFRYTPSEFIEGNRCVMPGLWLLVPDDWKRT
ncbi:hypothetical protein PMSD_06090 [Paenibacillus macquariensis subsp. defensor]|nr:hypothetical protein PMSD_06090 [Paenibacillus macquariensis subsp. defensor]